MKLTHGSLFSGIGGFDLAAEWAGWESKFHCEWNEFGQKVLKYYWPKAISYGDITKTDFTIHRGTIDVLTGGFPCQPYSLAGKRKGKEDERHLWPEMLRAIREIQPRYIVGENVYGLLNWNGGLVFNEVQTDLENEGYKVQPVILPACSVDAPHRRERIFFVAYANKCSSGKGNQPDRSRSRNNDEPESRREQTEQHTGHGNVYGFNSDTVCNRLQGSIYTGKNKTKGRETKNRYIEECLSNDWRNLQFGNFPTQSPVCNGNDGFSSRLDGITFSEWRRESIKAGGNAIVPQVAFQIFKAIVAHEALYGCR